MNKENKEKQLKFLLEKYKLNSLDDIVWEIRDSNNGNYNWFESKITDEILENYWRGDFRPKPIKPFEVGDWVLDCGVILKQLTEETINYFNGKRPYAQSTLAEHWIPKEGEYCWNLETKSLGCIKQIADTEFGIDYYFYSDSNGVQSYGAYSFNKFEPFAKNLPTFLKD